MRKASLNNKGFGLLAVLLVIVVLAGIGGAGAYVYHKNHKTKTTNNPTTTSTSKGSSNTQNNTPTPTPVDPYAGWKTYTSSNEGLSFRYPASWTVTQDPCDNPATGATGACVGITSPERAGSPYIFNFGLDWNSGTSSTTAQVYETTPLTVTGSKVSLYAVAQSNGNPNGGVCGIGLAASNYPVGRDNSVANYVSSQKQTGVSYTLGASMKPVAGSQNTPCYTLAQYQAQPDYQDLMKIFQSLQYS